MSKKTVILWVDASYRPGEEVSGWGLVYKCPETGEKISSSGSSYGVKNSTHAEVSGLFDALKLFMDRYPNFPLEEVILEARIDCKSIVDIFMNNHKTKDLHIGRVMYKLRNYFGESLRLVHVKGHCPSSNKEENAVRNREVHYLANKENKKAA